MFGTRRVRPSFGAAIASSPWIVVSIGVIVMVVLLVVALGSVRARRTYADGAPPDPVMSLPGLPAVTTSPPPSSAAAPVSPRLSPRATVPSATVPPSGSTPSPSTSAAGGSQPSDLPSSPPPEPLLASSSPPPVTGRYGVVDSFDDGFIGEVLLVNPSDKPSGWTVTLSFGRGRLVSSWVAGAEQGEASFAHGVFTYRSGVDLAAGASVRLRFHFEKTRSTRPTSCTVDGTDCSGL
ncbi:cellulose binding domain-containing protein [Micromonospora sp. SL1-18]|uniref:cellulose binding domain-containing protein n=1 Tax=Micromonospora sp. SL1-18 TaxID=3399128 RepID=UPI003A4D2B3C